MNWQETYADLTKEEDEIIHNHHTRKVKHPERYKENYTEVMLR